MDVGSSTFYLFRTMKIEISEEVINKTTKCHSDFYCLNDAENPKCSDGLAMCPVEKNIADGMVFVDFNNDFSCNYSMSFATDKRICHCPVRYEIYTRYKM